MQEINIEYRRLPFLDGGSLPEHGLLFETIDWLVQHRQCGHRCLIHCSAGVSRSPLVAAGLLAVENGTTLDEALESVRKWRVRVHPSQSLLDEMRDLLMKKS